MEPSEESTGPLVAAFLKSIGRVVGLLLGVLAGLIAVNRGFSRGLLFALFVSAGFLVGSVLDDRTRAIRSLHRFFTFRD